MTKAYSPHDLDLPAWGPYTKKYVGISHLTDPARGLRFDLSVFPGLYRRRVDVPRVTWESGYHPWEASVDLEYFCHRHEVEWKDRVYADISFSRLDEESRLVRAELVNRTDLPQSLTLQFMASLHFPPIRTYSEERLEPGTVDLPPGVSWFDFLGAEDVRFARPRPQDQLVYDAQFRGEVRDHGFVGGSALGQGFGQDRGDTVVWAVEVPQDLSEGAIVFRFRLPKMESLNLTLEGLVNQTVRIQGSGGLDTVVWPTGPLAPGRHRFQVTSEGGQSLEIDGWALGEARDVPGVRFSRTVWRPVPVIRRGPTDRSLMLHYPDAPVTYGLVWGEGDFDVREFYAAELDRFMRHYVHEHVVKVFRAEGDEHFTNLSLRPLVVEPQGQRVVHAVVVSGRADEVEARLKAGIPGAAEAIWVAQRSRSVAFPSNPAGLGYQFSQEKLAATLLCNVVFPVYVKGQFIRHQTPGKWWDCLYTWDSGFIGLGLLELDPGRAAENLLAYLTDPDDDQTAFLHHGSPVPVQAILFLDLWNRTGDAELLRIAYPRLKRYYQFLAGRGTSTTASLGSGLLKTWDYFYNSGGWDDYPAQVHTHHQRMTATTTPVITTSQVIRMGKILAMAADALGLDDDVAGFRHEGERFARALQDHAWDEQSGYFGYVVHDQGTLGILRHPTGENFNQGLDGLYPLVAGVCTPEQEARALDFLTSQDHLWTAVGITTVDQAAPYYRIDGYWNGAVWMAHQWYFWKTMLDLGQGAFAWQIARTALDIWKRETDETYCCMEHWVVASGRGAGWHQFGGLSSPVLGWFTAYFRPGTLTTGFDWRWDSFSTLPPGEGPGLSADLCYFGDKTRSTCVVVVLPPGPRYRATWNGNVLPLTPLVEGAWSLEVPGVPGERGRLEVRSVGPESGHL